MTRIQWYHRPLLWLGIIRPTDASDVGFHAWVVRSVIRRVVNICDQCRKSCIENCHETCYCNVYTGACYCGS